MLGSAFRHRAQLLPRAETGQRVEGRYLKTMGDGTPGPVFRCLFDPGTESESRDSGRVRRSRPATLTVGRRATDGTAIAIKASDRIRVNDAPGGPQTFEVQGTPAPIMKRRTVLGYTVTLQKVVA